MQISKRLFIPKLRWRIWIEALFGGSVFSGEVEDEKIKDEKMNRSFLLNAKKNGQYIGVVKKDGQQYQITDDKNYAKDGTATAIQNSDTIECAKDCAITEDRQVAVPGCGGITAMTQVNSIQFGAQLAGIFSLATHHLSTLVYTKEYSEHPGLIKKYLEKAPLIGHFFGQQKLPAESFRTKICNPKQLIYLAGLMGRRAKIFGSSCYIHVGAGYVLYPSTTNVTLNDEAKNTVATPRFVLFIKLSLPVRYNANFIIKISWIFSVAEKTKESCIKSICVGAIGYEQTIARPII
jgi:hypothetical protein